MDSNFEMISGSRNWWVNGRNTLKIKKLYFIMWSRHSNFPITPRFTSPATLRSVVKSFIFALSVNPNLCIFLNNHLPSSSIEKYWHSRFSVDTVCKSFTCKSYFVIGNYQVPLSSLPTFRLGSNLWREKIFAFYDPEFDKQVEQLLHIVITSYLASDSSGSQIHYHDMLCKN